MATASLGRPRRSVFSLSLLFLLVALTSSLPRATRADDEWDSDDASASASLDDDLAPSEDVPLHRFEIEVVTTGKASGKEKRVDKPAFFLRGDDASAAAARFVYLHALPLEHVAHFAEVFRSEWEGNVPDDRKPRVRASRSKPPGPAALLARGKAAAEEKDHESAYVDYVRAIVGEGVDAEDPARIALDGDEMDEAKELLRAHHALHSRALVAADKTREQRAVAHEREVDVLRARRARRDREREDLEDLVTMLGSELESSESSASPFDAATRDAVVRSIEAGDWDAVIAAVSAADAAAARAGHPVDALRKATLAYAHYATGASTAAERAADRSIAAGKTHGDWRRGQTRALAARVGANAAIRRGDVETALRFVALPVRADPDGAMFKGAYEALRGVQKELRDADAKLDRGESRLALDAVERASATIRGLGVRDGVGNVFADVESRRCVAHAQMRAFDLALAACEKAFAAVGCGAGAASPEAAKPEDSRETRRSCDDADARARARAHVARAEVHSRDKYPEGALADLHAAEELLAPDARRGSTDAAKALRDVGEKLAAANRAKHEHDNSRDHSKMLDLPENLHELEKERRCEFVKKAYKRAALKWHPDKATEAGKSRAARKMNEMTEARDHVNKRLGCVAPKRDPAEEAHRAAQQQWQQQQRARHFQQFQQRGRRTHFEF